MNVSRRRTYVAALSFEVRSGAATKTTMETCLDCVRKFVFHDQSPP